MPESIHLSADIPASPKRICDAWFNEEEHTNFTGSKAKIDPMVDGKYTAWDGYIYGKTINFKPYERITQTWRTVDFPEKSPDSILDIMLDETDRGTRLTLTHTNIPPGQAVLYEQGWKDFYLEPMKRYFQNL
jgi:activator of HSP90 ATPase